MVKAKNISFEINGKQIVQPMSFELSSHAVTVLLGPNGAGKSTLLRLLAGEKLQKGGEILLDDQPISDFRQDVLARKRAVLTQNYAVPLPFTCEEIVAMGRYPYEGISTTKENKEVVTHCMKQMEVQHFANRMFNTLSGGEQQRVQMARVLAQIGIQSKGESKILLLDEPTSSLDYLQQQLLLSKIKALASNGYAVIVVLHDLNLAAQYADKIVLLKEGYLVADGSTEEVLQAPLIKMAFDIDIDVVRQESYPFPILIPTMHNQNSIYQTLKSYK